MAAQSDTISFVTFGMFILDDIEWQTPNPPPPKTNLIGGAGTYAVLGARLAAPAHLSASHKISWVVDVGSDFPPEVKSSIDSWNTDCVYRYDSSRLTTRAWNGYGANELRAFKYLTPKIRLEVSSLNSAQVMSKSFHMVCSPDRCIDLTTKLRGARKAIDSTAQGPVIVWEPIPDLCSPEQLLRLQEAANLCTVISPNHDELKMFFPSEVADAETQLQLVTRLMSWNTTVDIDPASTTTQPSPPPPAPIVIVREGANGSTAYIRLPALLPSQSSTTTSPGPPSGIIDIHFSAYHTPSTSHLVTDPTGGGNTYLGAIALQLGLAKTNTDAYVVKMSQSIPLPARLRNLPPPPTNPQILANHAGRTAHASLHNTLISTYFAMLSATIAASFAIEQHGTPALSHRAKPSPGQRDQTAVADNETNTKIKTDTDTDTDTDTETWNGESVAQRTERYAEREKGAMHEQMEKVLRFTLGREGMDFDEVTEKGRGVIR